MEWERRQYHCSVCNANERPFKSRSEWLVHLVLSPHSVKVLESFQQWQNSKRGELYVISGLAHVENSMLLEYLSDNLQSFADIVFFKPRANICMIVGDARELSAFTELQHRVGGILLQFKAYKEINNVEWNSYFHDRQDELLAPESISSPSTSLPAAYSAPMKRKLDDTAHSNPSKSIKLTQSRTAPESPTYRAVGAVGGHGGTVDPQRPSATGNSSSEYFLDTTGTNWDEEIEKVQNYIFMSNTQIESRKNIITHLTDVFKQAHPKCKVIPVGSDILGFRLDQSLFTIYFDSKGLTEAENAKPQCTISETFAEVDRIRTSLFVKLKSLQTQGVLSNVQCQGANSIRFFHILFEINCNLILKPFMLAQTARLCKQLYFMNKDVAALLNMVTYWAMQHQHFCEVGLVNPYVVYWLVYFFFMQKKVLPPVIELQKSCGYEITDGLNNVAFSYDENVLSNVLNTHKCKIENARSQIERVLEWFQYVDDVFGETTGKGINRRHSLVCPRFAELVDKRKFRVVWEEFRKNKKKHTRDQKKVRVLWKNDLIRVGFEEAMWGNLLGLKMPDTLSVQHPLYIAENISLAFEGPFSKRFFAAIKKTRDQLAKLLSQDTSVTSLLLALSDFSM